MAIATRCDHATPLYPQKLALTSPTSGGCSAGIVRLRTEATKLLLLLLLLLLFYKLESTMFRNQDLSLSSGEGRETFTLLRLL
jgi:hypothetical protein